MTNDPDHDPAPPFVDPDSTLRRVAFDLGTLDDDDVTDGTVDDLGRRLILASSARAAAGELVDMLELALVDAMPDDVLTVAGMGVLTRGERSRESWRNDSSGEAMRRDLSQAIVNDLATSKLTGEIDPMVRRIAALAIHELYQSIGTFTSVLQAARNRYGIQMSNYRNRQTYYRITVETENDDR